MLRPKRPGNPQGGMETDSRRRPGLMRPARRRAEESLKRAMEARFFASSTTTAGRTTRRSGPPNPEAAAPPEADPPRPGKVPLGRAPFPGPARGPDEAAGGRSSLEGASRSVSVTQPAHRTPQAPCPPSREWFSGLPPLPSPPLSCRPLPPSPYGTGFRSHRPERISRQADRRAARSESLCPSPRRPRPRPPPAPPARAPLGVWPDGRPWWPTALRAGRPSRRRSGGSARAMRQAPAEDLRKADRTDAPRLLSPAISHSRAPSMRPSRRSDGPGAP